MRNRILFLAFSLFFAKGVSAQIVGTDCFLQGQFTEAGVNQMGGLGTCNSPAAFHVHACCALTPAVSGIPTTDMDVSYDWGHDGWLVGTNPFVGPYTIPGYPQEGWSVQVGATEYRNGGWGGACTGAFAIPGGHTGYSNTGGSAIEYWGGAIAGLNIRQETRVDTMASWVSVTAVLRNTTAAPIAGVWYERTCDPDNTTYWQGTPVTRNIIKHQNEDLRHLVHVVAHGQTPAAPPKPEYNQFNTYLALVTKDCRARCGVIPGLSPGNIPSTLWAGTGTSLFLLNDSNYNDQGIFIVFNIGTIAPGDSAVVSYAYLYQNDGTHSGIDSAFPDPHIRVHNDTMPSTPMLSPQYDTFDACLYPGLLTLNVDLLYSSDKSWTTSTWTWSPGTGLAATTGVNNVITLSALPTITTYTITGTCGPTCLSKTFYLTVLTCNGATSNSPCVGDTLKLNAPGDSTAATYRWYGPASATTVISTSQAFNIYPAAVTDAGVYTVIKTVGTNNDTATTTATVYALPVLTLSSNIPDCGPMQDPLNLFCNTDSLCNIFTWTGPGGFTSTLQNPSLTFDSSLAGIYFAEAVSTKGKCRNMNSIHIKPGVVPDFTFERHPGCPYDTLLITGNSTFNANAYSWDFDVTSGPTSQDANRNPAAYLYPTANKIYTVTLTASNPYCTAAKSYAVDMRHSVKADFAGMPDTICNGATLIINDLSSASKYGNPVSPLFSHEWNYGDGNTDNTNGSPAGHIYANEGIYPAWLIATDSLGCKDTATKNIWVLQPYTRGMSDSTFCLTQPLKLYNWQYMIPNLKLPYGYTYNWSPAANLDNATKKEPMFNAIGQYTYTQTATLGHFGCEAKYVLKLNSILPRQLHNVTRDTKIMYGNRLQLNADSELFYMWTPNDGSLDNPNISNPIATPTVTTTYTIYGMDFYGCRDTATVTIVVDSTMSEFVPTAFTPNGDGKNDVFRLNGSRFQNLVEMRIYNRWGQQVFYTSNREVGWDGTFEGQKMDIGTYHYSIIVARPGHPENTVYKGDITLIR